MMPQPQPLPLPQAKRPANAVAQVLSLPPRWLALYDDFISKNAGQVSQIESALRSLTYIIPGLSLPSPLSLPMERDLCVCVCVCVCLSWS